MTPKIPYSIRDICTALADVTEDLQETHAFFRATAGDQVGYLTTCKMVLDASV